MLFLTILPHIPGAWIRDAPVGTHCNNMESLTPSVPRCAGAPDGMGTKFFAVHPSSTASQQPTPRPSSGCGRALCEPQNTHLVGEGQGFVVLSTAGTQKREQEPWKEVSSEDGPQVGGSCPGVTQCIPPICPTGRVLPLEQGADLMPTILLLSPLGWQKPCSVSWFPVLSAAQIHQKNPFLARLERPQAGLRSPNTGSRDTAKPTASTQTEVAFKCRVG